MMPRINKPQRKPKTTYHGNTDMRELRKRAYATTRWKNLRTIYLKQHPVCEECLMEGKVNAGSLEDPLQVHHKKSPFRGGVIDYDLLYDVNNLETVCSQCHARIHNEERGHQSPEKIIAILDELLLDDNWDDDDTTGDN